ncbi:hypothetical protein FRC03_005151 [Tulasnella sp. 419]|nr:hypothetical protein FRC03_005151 [Tulasnella sp. 419]
MFGSNTGWGQNTNQNQQNPPQQTNAFGQPAQPSAFGTTGNVHCFDATASFA